MIRTRYVDSLSGHLDKDRFVRAVDQVSRPLICHWTCDHTQDSRHIHPPITLDSGQTSEEALHNCT